MADETNMEAVKEHFANLGEKLDRIIGHVGYRQLPDYVEDITLSSQYQGPVKLRGYRYLYMLVSADAVTAMASSNLMTLDIGGGVTYLQQLKPGWNVIDAPREFRYRVSGLTGNPPALLVHTNDLKAMDGVVSYSGGGVGGSAGNPSYTELTGSLPPLGDVQPILVATIPYTDFTTASQSIYGYLPASMTRNVRARSLIVTNTLNQALTSVGFYPYDSTTAEGAPSGIAGGFTWNSGPGSGGDVMTLTSEQASQGGAGTLATHVDSFQYGLGMGATLPTSGNVYIHIVEVH